jgi:5-methylcytosine-specific restriction enzyme subunit McrC
VLPTFELTERVGRCCRLAPADVDFLVAEHRAHLTLLPTGEPGCFQLTPRGYVGTIVAPGCRLVIRPKIPLKALGYLLDPTGDLAATPDQATTGPGTDLLDLLAVRLAALMTQRAAAGLHRAYVEHAIEGPFLHGRLDVPAQLRDAPGGKDRLHSRCEDFTANVPCNQLPRATAELVLDSPLLGEASRVALSLALRAFAEVGTIPLSPESFSQHTPDRLTQPYQALLDLCRLLAESLAPTATPGLTPCPAFLLDMERVFESYCIRGLRAGVAERRNHHIGVQPLFRASRATSAGPDLWMRPDFTLHEDGRPVVVVDAKWKRSPGLRADLYQVLGYCAALGFPRGILVYPGRRDRACHYCFRGEHGQVTIWILQVIGSRPALERSLRKLAREIMRPA